MELTDNGWMAIGATVITFVVCLIVSICCRKKYLHNGCHKKKSIAGMIVCLIIWIIAFVLIAWSWYWTSKNTSGKVRNTFNWLYGLSLLSILLWFLMFFICGSVSASLLVLTVLIFLTVGLAVQAGIEQNYWIMAFEILFAIYIIIIAVMGCVAYSSMGYSGEGDYNSDKRITLEKSQTMKETLSF